MKRNNRKLTIAFCGTVVFLLIIYPIVFSQKERVIKLSKIQDDVGLKLEGDISSIVDQFREMIIYTIEKGYFESPAKPGNFVYEGGYIPTIKSAKAEFNSGSIKIESWRLWPDRGVFTVNLLSWRKELINIQGIVSIDVYGNRYFIYQTARALYVDENGRRAPK